MGAPNSIILHLGEDLNKDCSKLHKISAETSRCSFPGKLPWGGEKLPWGGGKEISRPCVGAGFGERADLHRSCRSPVSKGRVLAGEELGVQRSAGGDRMHDEDACGAPPRCSSQRFDQHEARASPKRACAFNKTTSSKDGSSPLFKSDADAREGILASATTAWCRFLPVLGLPHLPPLPLPGGSVAPPGTLGRYMQCWHVRIVCRLLAVRAPHPANRVPLVCRVPCAGAGMELRGIDSDSAVTTRSGRRTASPS